MNWPNEFGPQSGSGWVIDDDERVRAKQLDMLSIDERCSAQWVETMRKLVDEALDDEAFTIKRMTLLKLWERNRKREQANLHYRYDPRRRNPRLVARDVAAQLARAKAQITEYRARQDQRDRELGSAQEAEVDTKPTPAPRPPRKRVRSLEGLKPELLAVISNTCGIQDLAFATDKAILDGYENETGVRLGADEAARYLAYLTPANP